MTEATNARIDAIIVDLADCRDNVHTILNVMEGKLETIAVDLDTHKRDVSALSAELSRVAVSLESMHDIMVAWNNTQGFISGIRFIAGAAKILAPIIVLFGLVALSVNYVTNRWFS